MVVIASIDGMPEYCVIQSPGIIFFQLNQAGLNKIILHRLKQDYSV